MCGIVGCYSKYGIKNQKQKLLKSVNLLKHRGPEGSNSWSSDQFFLGYRSLAFFGETSQPLHNEDNSIHIVCNGEIYNHRNVRDKLKSTHTFSSDSDCEVIVHLYEEYGTDLLSHIKGQFAFILIDEKNKHIFAARDKFGICPLFYTKNYQEYFFASEIKSLLDFNQHKVDLNLEGILNTVFLYGPTAPQTCFTNIFEIPPGSFFFADIHKGNAKIKKYWSLNFSENQTSQNQEERYEKFEKLLQEAVVKRLQGYAIPAVYTSGGLDSSLIAALVSRYEPRTKVFSIQFKNKKYDESQFQKELKNHLKIKHEKILITDEDIRSNIIKTVWHAECPLSRSAPIPMFLLSELVRKSGYKCVITGEGADELLAGYPVFLKNIPSIVTKVKLGKKILDLCTSEKKNQFKKQKKVSHRQTLNLHESQKIEVNTKLSRYLLAAQGDRVSMANGIEQRFPFLDDDLVEYCTQLPAEDFISNDQGKYILRQIAKKYVPSSIVNRPKQGYLSPDTFSIKDPLLKELLSQEALKSTNIFDKSKVNNFLAFYKNLKSNEDSNASSVLFFIMTVQILHKLFIQRDESFLRSQ